MDKMMFEKRVRTLVEVLKRDNVDAYLCGLGDNGYYFSNFPGIQRERMHCFLIPIESEPIFFVPNLNANFVKESSWIDNVPTWNEGDDPYRIMSTIIKEKKLSTIAIDEVFRSDFLISLQERLPQVRFVVGTKYTSMLRMIKSKEEADIMRKAGEIHVDAIKNAISAIKVGISELEIANIIIDTFKEQGAVCAGRLPNVGSGVHSTHPHHFAREDKLIEDGDSIVLDFTGEFKHYRSDGARTVFVGKPPQEYLKIYETVKRAQSAAVKSIKPGQTTCEDVDRVARKIIEDEGYGKYFIHRTGHGLGLDVHEDPYIAEGNKLVIMPGMVFSVEPGIYYPPKFGVRIEDIVIATETGVESFTNMTHDLIIK